MAARRGLPDLTIGEDPPEWFVEDLRRRFPTEAEVDRMLTAKMRARGGPAYRRPDPAEMRERLDAFFAHTLEGPFEVGPLRWSTGGVSKIQITFTLTRRDPADGRRREDRLVLRMDPVEGSNATSRSREFELLRLANGVLPVPEVFWVDAEARWFPRPALVYAFAEGVTRPSVATTGAVSGIGTDFGPHHRALLAPQFMEHLARLHTLDLGEWHFTSLEVPEAGTTQAASWLLNQARRTWEEDRAEDLLLMEVAANWLADNLPILDRAGVVHGDFRAGNFLFDEESGRITAWLDWERGHLGDRHRDLAWMTQRTFGHLGEDGRFLVCGLVPEDEFYDTYERLSGLRVDAERLVFHRVLNAYALVVSALASAQRVARLGRSHQDIVLARVEGVVPVVLGELRDLLMDRI
ncbi:phosphotransferase family protein [Pseudonocardia halophobica]|uniref:phosphotransferase family protein n=1 Tax=Pseudonocardia halophobica TaxID=29401 RepID=UPI003D925CA6